MCRTQARRSTRRRTSSRRSASVGAVAAVEWRRRRPRRPSRRPASPATTSMPGRKPAEQARPTRWARPTRLALIALASSIVLTAAVVVERPSGHPTVTVLDVGQGDAILVEGSRGGRLLIDGGPDPDRLLVELDRLIPPWDRRLDAVVLSHPHEDHVAGLAMLLERYRVARTFEPGMLGPGPGYAAWAAELAGRPTPGGLLAAGDRLVRRRHRARGPVADAGFGAPRATGRRHRDQQRVDRPARLGGRPSVPAHGRRRAGGRPRVAGTPRTRGPAEDRPPRQQDRVHGCLPRRRRCDRGRGVGRDRQSVRPSLPGDAVADRGQGRARLPDRPRRQRPRRVRNDRDHGPREWRPPAANAPTHTLRGPRRHGSRGLRLRRAAAIRGGRARRRGQSANPPSDLDPAGRSPLVPSAR